MEVKESRGRAVPISTRRRWPEVHNGQCAAEFPSRGGNSVLAGGG
jgi:hypothetical protein